MADRQDNRLRVVIRPMTHTDIDRVLVLDRLSFPNPWPPQIYRNELGHTERARMYALELADHQPSQNGHRPGLLQRIFGRSHSSESLHPLIGYAGYWHIVDESHISTIAIHPDWRGHKLGELLVWIMSRQALRQNARILTLEVRVSNDVAQHLYRKYGFQVLGVRKGYYRDNGEDAYNMGVEVGDEAYRDRLVEYGNVLRQHLHIIDRV